MASRPKGSAQLETLQLGVLQLTLFQATQILGHPYSFSTPNSRIFVKKIDHTDVGLLLTSHENT